jgi:hypothetical protein
MAIFDRISKADIKAGYTHVALAFGWVPIYYNEHTHEFAVRNWLPESSAGALQRREHDRGGGVEARIPGDLRVIDGKPLPNLRDTEIALLQAEKLSPAAGRLRDHVIRSLG